MPLQGSSQIHQCPPEIWTEIFNTACLDDGFTARSLVQVSRHMRAISVGHLYRSIKIGTSEQLVKLETQLSNRAPGSVVTGLEALKTRFLCIILPLDVFEEAYPSDEPGVWAPEESVAIDPNYHPLDSGSSEDSCSLGSDSESDTSESSLYEGDTVGSEDQELLSELADIAAEEAANGPATAIKISSLSDFEFSHCEVNRQQHRVYGAMRRILEACASTLEVFALHYDPGRILLPYDFMIPPLPCLRQLSISMTHGSMRGCLDREPWVDYSLTPTRYPSLRDLRLLGRHLNSAWWESIIQSIPDSKDVKITSLLWIYRHLGYCRKQKGEHRWEFLDSEIFDQLRDLTATWWLEDVKGNCEPCREYLDGKHGAGYIYETDDDL
ncbi:hypothetical protein DFP72DRAFT_920028 [Ephemerocybe angulata]|uniref:Uncharacterized protein n=1 Tax=Ephemerocybe angulata TaxID=980116 RepID=A0A8H6HJ75_9AGAR|nr:hypothetical protein DFP72DRAFT_920028 [Tulosesus angulatus]